MVSKKKFYKFCSKMSDKTKSCHIYIKCPCVCPVYMSKIGMWAFSVSGKEILNFSNYQNSKYQKG